MMDLYQGLLLYDPPKRTGYRVFTINYLWSKI